ncbi:MAG: hypothetical protein KAI24_02335 [Planctomycetes bacterium]|nr:hypothetical protein [Planctomycetota bacterium]
MNTQQKSGSDWLRTFLPLGTTIGESWEPLGAGVLMMDASMVWLVTAREVAEASVRQQLTTWVPRADDVVLLDLSDSQTRSGLNWIHHPAGLSASLFPLAKDFVIKAFAETQCTRVQGLQPLVPTASVGILYGPDVPAPRPPTPNVCEGIVSSADPHSGRILSTAPMLPRNAGAPLLLASPYGGQVTLAGIQLGNILVNENDPRMLPLRFSSSTCVDAALELIRGEDAQEQLRRIAPPPDAPATEQEDAS